MRWPKRIVVWVGNDDAMHACSAMGYEPWVNVRQRVYVLQPLPKKRKRRKVKKSK